MPRSHIGAVVLWLLTSHGLYLLEGRNMRTQVRVQGNGSGWVLIESMRNVGIAHNKVKTR
jgi:hypothetical protein